MKYLYTLISIGLIVPQIALASWWNPLSWSKKQVVPVPVVQVATTTKTVEEKPKEVIKAEVKVKKPDIKPVIKSKPKTTPVPVVAPVVSPVVQIPVIAPPIQIATSSVLVVPIVKVSKYLPSIEAINAFLANPTEQSLREYCTKAKTLIAPGDKKALNESRTDYVTVSQNLYDESDLCHKVIEGRITANGTRKQLISLFPNDASYLFNLDDSNESNAVREFKVSFNSYWKSISNYRLLGLPYTVYRGVPVSISTIQTIIVERLEKDPNAYNTKSVERHFNLIIPEKILSELRNKLIKYE